MDQDKLKALIEEATTACYDEEEAFWGMFCTLQMRMTFPLQAKVGGSEASLTGLDEPNSDPQKGAMAQISRGGGDESVALTEVELVDPDPASAEWLAAYKYWLDQK